MGGELIGVWRSGWRGQSWRLCLVSLIRTQELVSSYTDFGTATLWTRLPNLKLAIPFEEVKYSPPTKDVGIGELSVVF